MNRSLSERDQQVIWHPYTPQKYATPPIPITKANGIYLEDEKGNKYIDAISSWWVTIHGHAHPYIAKKIYEQALLLEQVIFAGFTHEPAVSLAERLLPKLPGDFTKIFYSDNGSTAVEVAIKMSLQFWWNQEERGRRKVLAFRNAYHGDTFGAMSVSARSLFTAAFDTFLFEVIYLEVPDAMNFETNKKIIDQFASETACFIYEPLLQGAGGMKMYDAVELNLLLSYIQSQEIVLIADEVLTGFGRTGKLFAGDYLETKADIICLSKGLTGGTMAMGVTACTPRIYEAFLSDDRYKTFFHGHSFTANPIACSAALASLDLLEQQNCLDNIRLIERHQSDFLSVLGAGSYLQQLKNIRTIGTILAFDLSGGPDGYLNQAGAGLAKKALSHGIYLRPLGNTVYIMPPYCITKEQLMRIYNVIEGALK
jgi:adenosylmethionine-8-amino-7-oxononanoate aminotransferase